MTLYWDSVRAFLKPVLAYLDDETVTEVMVNAADEVWIEREGRLLRTPARFTEDSLLAAARNVAQFVGRVLDDDHPRLDARLPDGSRIHVVMPPVARRGAALSVRKFHRGGLGLDDLLRGGSLSPEAARFLEAVVVAKRNLVIAGGTGSGKTTILGILAGFIPDPERILTIEDSAELQIVKPHVVGLEARAAGRDGRGAVTLRDLLNSALRLRPDRILVGEVRGGECFELLQAMNTGHGGTMTTAHANSPIETLSRLESLCLLSGVELPLRAIRSQIATAMDLVAISSRLADGSRRITAIAEVLPLDVRGDYQVRDLFVFHQTRRDDRRVEGYLAPTGATPTFLRRLVSEGFGDLDEHFFDPATYGYPVEATSLRRPPEAAEAAPPPGTAVTAPAAVAAGGGRPWEGEAEREEATNPALALPEGAGDPGDE